MVFNATFKNISAIAWRSVLLVEETGVLGKKQLTYHKSLVMNNGQSRETGNIDEEKQNKSTI